MRGSIRSLGNGAGARGRGVAWWVALTVASLAWASPALAIIVSGTVFEDVNYGGGAGRSQAAAAGVGRPGVRVELYDALGNFDSFDITNAAGDYSFNGIPSGTWTVRVVSGTVSSSRAGYIPGLVPVQTYRTTGASGSAVAVTDHVGGEVPSKRDAGSGSTTLAALTTATTTPQSIAAVTSVGSISGIDFGFNFDTIVNANDSGQGSLRQFVLDANPLGNAGLAQSGRRAGLDNAVFMLADGTARPGLNASYASQFVAGVAPIALASALPALSSPAVIDAHTQPGWTSGPIVELNGAAAGAATDGLSLTAGGTTVRGLVIDRFAAHGISIASAAGDTVEGCRIGTDASGAAAPNGGSGVVIMTGATNNVLGGLTAGAGNVIATNGQHGVVITDNGTRGNAVLGNSIFGDGGIGITLFADGVTPNNGTKNVTLPNEDMDSPVLTSAALAGPSLNVTGYVGSAAGQATFANARVEVFISDNDPGGFGEGRTYLGALTSDASGNFSGSVPAFGVTVGDRITATATDASGNTSEFGANLFVQPLSIVKRAFDLSGAPIATGTVIPKGAVVRWLLYVNNPGPVVSDASLRDVLDPAFAYVPGTIRTINTPAACATSTCSGAEEAAIFAAAGTGTLVTDATDGDAVSRTGATIDAGNQNVGNGQLDLAAGKVFAVVFTVRMR